MKTLTGYVWGTYAQVAYLTPDGHVHDLYSRNNTPLLLKLYRKAWTFDI